MCRGGYFSYHKSTEFYHYSARRNVIFCIQPRKQWLPERQDTAPRLTTPRNPNSSGKTNDGLAQERPESKGLDDASHMQSENRWWGLLGAFRELSRPPDRSGVRCRDEAGLGGTSLFGTLATSPGGGGGGVVCQARPPLARGGRMQLLPKEPLSFEWTPSCKSRAENAGGHLQRNRQRLRWSPRPCVTSGPFRSRCFAGKINVRWRGHKAPAPTRRMQSIGYLQRFQEPDLPCTTQYGVLWHH